VTAKIVDEESLAPFNIDVEVEVSNATAKEDSTSTNNCKKLSSEIRPIESGSIVEIDLNSEKISPLNDDELVSF